VNTTQLIITVGYSFLLVICVWGLVLLVRSTRRPNPDPPTEKIERGENVWGYIVAAILILVLGLTIWQIPYFSSADAAGQQVAVTAQQYAWTLKPNRVRAGKPVEFHLLSRDVQHGFGVYDGTKLLFQVQVPAKGSSQQKYTYTFDKPGRYEILCLEFCGFQHHLMRGVIQVQ
jgi:cytochrome c oxidase subunit II